ncbi:hypothetical protein OU994_18115 [Pseudoduganella sp. SL102]|uniref:hypothetical protein n=1 Tax=Pseudoduganella sp. SL102 TaxID=2995154 RepID=UPI00248B3DF1|nr:hypothetical protein [Pseudoduganella sp. SL102]WBS00237.1 hypothetical protein OU994_18115 [Pseudoduganella sp. SL102]
MTHTHADRVAERDPCMCIAYGCPLLGVITASTSGANDWACFFHAGRSGAQLQHITMIVNRYRWLADSITIARGMVPGRADRRMILDKIRADLTQHKRPDLFWNGAETVRQWVNRLDKALGELVSPHMDGIEAPQASVPRDSWQGVGASLPNWA